MCEGRLIIVEKDLMKDDKKYLRNLLSFRDSELSKL